MRKEYDFSTAKLNPYVKRLKKAVTIRLEPDVINYFKALSTDTGIPYQNLINLYLLDCAKEQRRLTLTWKNNANGAMDRITMPSALLSCLLLIPLRG